MKEASSMAMYNVALHCRFRLKRVAAVLYMPTCQVVRLPDITLPPESMIPV